MSIIDELGAYLNAAPPREAAMLTALICAALLSLCLRYCAAWAYGWRWTAFRFGIRPLETKMDIDALKTGHFARLAKTFAARGERSPERLDARAVVEADLLRVGAGRWAARLAESLEWAVLAGGAAFIAAAEGNRAMFALCAAALYASLKILNAFADPEQARARYVTLAADALERAVGRFYAARTAAGELKRAAAELSETLDAATRASVSALSAGLKDAALTLGGLLAEHGQSVARAAADMTAQANTLREAANSLAARNDQFEAQNALIRENQAALERAVSQYEVALQNVTTEMGAAFGKMAEYHIREACRGIQGNVE